MTSRWILPTTYPRHFTALNKLPATLGELNLPLFQAVATEFCLATGYPMDLGYFGALSTMSVALQNQIDMVTPKGRRPVSLYMLGIGGTSRGKSVLAEHFIEPLETFEDSREDLLRGHPLTYTEGSGPKLFESMKAFPTRFLVSYEGHQLLSSIVRSEASKLNNLWSGEPVRRSTFKHGNLALRHARVSILALVHPEFMDDVMRIHGRALRTSGFLGRLLVVATPERPLIEAVHGVRIPLPARDAFFARLLALLEVGIEAAFTPNVQRFAPPLSDDAERLRVVYAQSRIEMTGERGHFETEPEHALKLAENAVRVAVLLHVFEGFEGQVSESTLWAAIALVEWFSLHYLDNLGSTGNLNTKLGLLHQWIVKRFWDARTGSPIRFPRSVIGQLGPNRLRDPKVYEPLLDGLESLGMIRRFRSGGGVFIELVPPSAHHSHV